MQSCRFWFQILTGAVDAIVFLGFWLTSTEIVERKDLLFLYIYFGSSILRLVRVQPVCATIYHARKAKQLKMRKGLSADAKAAERTIELSNVSEVLQHRDDQQWLDKPADELDDHEQQMLVFTSKMIEPSVMRSLQLQLKLINRVKGQFEWGMGGVLCMVQVQ